MFVLYQDKTPAAACIQDVLYADDLAMVAKTREEMQHMVGQNLHSAKQTKWKETTTRWSTPALV